MSVTVRRDGEIKEFAVQIAKMPEHVIRRRLDFDGVMAAHGGKTEIHIGGDDPRADDSRIVMLREGTLPRMPMPGRMYVFAPDGIFGARVSPVTPELARVLKLETGVLINDVADESPAAKSGLHAGDVIVGAEGQSIATLNELQRVIAAHLSARAVELQVVREKKPRKLTVSW
jgi:membrane-associated protease RseP (regulator of RpoE activity)